MKTQTDDIFSIMTPEETAELLEGIDIDAIGREHKEFKVRKRPRIGRILAAALIAVVGFALLTFTVTAAVPSVLPVVSEKIIPILRNIFSSEEELINPWAEPIDSGAVVDDENTVFRLDKAVKSGDNIFIYYSIETEKELYGDLVGYEILRISTPEGDSIYDSQGNIMAGELLCRTEQGGGIIHIKKSGGYTGGLTLSIQNLYSADSYAITVENAYDLSAYTETIAEEVTIDFTLPELDNLEYTTLVDGKEFMIEGHRTIVDIRVSALSIEATFTLPDFDCNESIPAILSGTTMYEINQGHKKDKEAHEAGEDPWIYQYRNPMRHLHAQFYGYEDGWYHTGWRSTGYDGHNFGRNTSVMTMTFEEPISPDQIEYISFGFNDVINKEGVLVLAEEFGETIYLYGEPRETAAE